jgi:hypothetical protein
VTGSVANPDVPDAEQGEDANSPESAAAPAAEEEGSLAPFLDPALPEAQRKRLLKLATLRKKPGRSKQDEFWQVRLPEYMAVYMNRFEVCQGFWTALIPPCYEAMRVDLALLEIQSADWIMQLDAMRIWFDEQEKIEKPGAFGRTQRDPFLKKLGSFLENVAPEVVQLRDKVMKTKETVTQLWKWLGELMGAEPTLIFKYVHDFSDMFQKQWKLLETNWDHKRTMTLRETFSLDLAALKLPSPTPSPPTQPRKPKKPAQEQASSLSQQLQLAQRHMKGEMMDESEILPPAAPSPPSNSSSPKEAKGSDEKDISSPASSSSGEAAQEREVKVKPKRPSSRAPQLMSDLQSPPASVNVTSSLTATPDPKEAQPKEVKAKSKTSKRALPPSPPPKPKRKIQKNLPTVSADTDMVEIPSKAKRKRPKPSKP